MGCGLSENFTLCNKIYNALSFKVLYINMPRHASKLSENFTFQFYVHNLLFFYCIASSMSRSRLWRVRIFYSLPL
jgi:hypothetical protein